MTHFQTSENALHATFQFRDFVEAFSFMTQVAFAAERHNHHPNWDNVWNRVHIMLTTHDAGNTITEKDTLLAETIEEIYARFAQPQVPNNTAG